MRRPLGHCVGLLSALVLTVTGCSGDDEVTAAHCDEIRERADAFSAAGPKEVPATLVGALRAVIDDGSAPPELREAYDTLTEAGSDEELDDALTQIDRIVAGCGVELDG